MAEKFREIRIYRSNKDNNGFASAWQLAHKPENKYEPYIFFLTMAKQIGLDDKDNAKYDWDNSIKVKLSEFDLGEVIAVLDGRKASLGYKGSLFHQSPNGSNKVIKLDSSDKGMRLSVSGQTAEKVPIGNFFQTLGEGESVILSVMIKRAIVQMYGW